MRAAAAPLWRPVLPLVAALAVGACAGGAGESSPSTASTPTDATAGDPMDRAAPAPSTSSADDSLGSDLAGIVGIALRSGGLIPPDEACADRALADLPASGKDALDALRSNPLDGADPNGARQVYAMYLDCVAPAALRMALVLGVLRAPPEALTCVSEAWSDVVDRDAVASSLAFGHGLDDLAPAHVDELVAAASPCLADERWWVDEIALDTERNEQLDPDAATCVAERYVAELGFAEAIRRRVLTIPLLALAPADTARLDLPARCGLLERPAPVQLAAPVGACLTGFGDGTAVTTITSCDGEHNAEVVAVVDLGAEYRSWPGAQVVRGAIDRHCGPAMRALGADLTDHGLGYDIPTRVTWEQGVRDLTCTLIRPDFTSWVGPSGVVPTAPPPTTATPATDAAPGTTLPDGAREMFDLEAIDRVGMCVYRLPAVPGQDDVDRRSFEVACTQPHQSELLAIGDVPGGPDDPYPGDAAVTADGDALCLAAFPGYVGAEFEDSQLTYTYFYPSPGTWAEGDRSVSCFVVGMEVDELFTVALAGSGM